MLVGWKYVGWSKEVWFTSKLAAWLHYGKHPYPAQERDGCLTQSQASATSRRDILLEKFRDSTAVTDKLFRVNKKIVNVWRLRLYLSLLCYMTCICKPLWTIEVCSMWFAWWLLRMLNEAETAVVWIQAPAILTWNCCDSELTYAASCFTTLSDIAYACASGLLLCFWVSSEYWLDLELSDAFHDFCVMATDGWIQNFSSSI
jgi:hypothetical protein